LSRSCGPAVALKRAYPIGWHFSIGGYATLNSTEITKGIHRISVWDVENLAAMLPDGASFNLFLVAADKPTIITTGWRRSFELMRDSVSNIVDPASLRYIVVPHHEGDSSGAINSWLATAPSAVAACSESCAALFLRDPADREPMVVTDGQVLDLGSHRLRFLVTPQINRRESLMVYEETTCTLFPNDLFSMLGVDVSTDKDVCMENLEEARKAGYQPDDLVELDRVLIKIERLELKAIAPLHGPVLTAHFEELIRCFRESSRALVRGVGNAGWRRFSEYQVGDVIKGRKIQLIYGTSDVAIVYRDTDGKVNWQIASDSISRTQNLVNQAYDRLAARVKGSLSSHQRTGFHDQLAAAFFLALTESDEKVALAAFSDCESLISEASLHRARFIYVVAGTITAAIAAVSVYVLAWVHAEPPHTLALGALAGVAGAWTSILIRSATLALGPFQASGQYTFQGATRILLGGLFGLFAAIAAKANLLVGFAFDNQWVMAVITFFAGFSERFVPELLQSLEKQHPTLSKRTSTNRGNKHAG
jgi:hypothetical protein